MGNPTLLEAGINLTHSIDASLGLPPKRVLSQLKLIIRPMYSSPPIHGALLVAEVLDDATLAAQYYRECASMAARIKEMRGTLIG